jgi:nitrite reductase/ring-hydroxylating ferredoxin subunit
MSKIRAELINASHLEEGVSQAFVINGWPILLCRNDGQIYALLNRCSHQASPLVGGRVRRGAISCPLHGTRFRLDTGRCMGGMDYDDLRTFPVSENDKGMIEVLVPDEQPGVRERPV